ncbi:hypothetical protein DdX_05048 [Ditylenchus destructor]|uniref:Uncharacterized protein n=1 Tax=Ditylenchus destructor TaxID=166010 RepID=A0AAD4NAI9_9BILA|nr:hypothetical protein DdX_05048 [Ditylenchus destructor]
MGGMWWTEDMDEGWTLPIVTWDIVTFDISSNASNGGNIDRRSCAAAKSYNEPTHNYPMDILPLTKEARRALTYPVTVGPASGFENKAVRIVSFDNPSVYECFKLETWHFLHIRYLSHSSGHENYSESDKNPNMTFFQEEKDRIRGKVSAKFGFHLLQMVFEDDEAHERVVVNEPQMIKGDEKKNVSINRCTLSTKEKVQEEMIMYSFNLRANESTIQNVLSRCLNFDNIKTSLNCSNNKLVREFQRAEANREYTLRKYNHLKEWELFKQKRSSIWALKPSWTDGGVGKAQLLIPTDYYSSGDICLLMED